jgi:hypothetical protein
MLRLAQAVLLGGASSACGFAALGLALYARSPSALEAATLFGGIGFVCGMVCNGLQALLAGLPGHGQAPLQPQELAGMVRATLAAAAGERAPRAGSAAGLRPPAVIPTTGDAKSPGSADDRRFASSAFGA